MKAVLMFFGVLGTMLLGPFLVIAYALLRALILAIPAAWFFGHVHNHIPMIPAYGVVTSFWVIALLSVLIPHGALKTSSD